MEGGVLVWVMHKKTFSFLSGKVRDEGNLVFYFLFYHKKEIKIYNIKVKITW